MTKPAEALEWLPDMRPGDLLKLLEIERDYLRNRHSYDMTPQLHIRICDREIAVERKIALVKRCIRNADTEIAP